MAIKTLSEKEVEKCFEELSGLQPGTEEHKAVLEEVTKLMDRNIEMDKLDLERTERIDFKEYEIELKERQMKEDKTNRWTRDITNWANLGIGAAMFIWGTVVSINFEREGTFTTTAGRKNVQKVLSWFK